MTKNVNIKITGDTSDIERDLAHVKSKLDDMSASAAKAAKSAASMSSGMESFSSFAKGFITLELAKKVAAFAAEALKAGAAMENIDPATKESAQRLLDMGTSTKRIGENIVLAVASLTSGKGIVAYWAEEFSNLADEWATLIGADTKVVAEFRQLNKDRLARSTQVNALASQVNDLVGARKALLSTSVDFQRVGKEQEKQAIEAIRNIGNQLGYTKNQIDQIISKANVASGLQAGAAMDRAAAAGKSPTGTAREIDWEKIQSDRMDKIAELEDEKNKQASESFERLVKAQIAAERRQKMMRAGQLDWKFIGEEGRAFPIYINQVRDTRRDFGTGYSEMIRTLSRFGDETLQQITSDLPSLEESNKELRLLQESMDRYLKSLEEKTIAMRASYEQEREQRLKRVKEEAEARQFDKEWQENEARRKEKYRLEELRGIQAVGEAYTSLFNGMAALAARGDMRDKARRRQWKALAIAEATAATAVGVTKALEQGGPLGLITGAGVFMAGMAQVDTIRAQKFAKGGVVRGPDTGDRVAIRANGGEMILTKEQQARLFAMASGGGGGGTTITYAPVYQYRASENERRDDYRSFVREVRTATSSASFGRMAGALL